MSTEASNNNASKENVQRETGKPISQDAYKLVDDCLFFWLGNKQFYNEGTGQYSEPKPGVTLGNVDAKRYVNFPATKKFFEMFNEHMINDILPMMKKFCTLEVDDTSAPRIINNLKD